MLSSFSITFCPKFLSSVVIALTRSVSCNRVCAIPVIFNGFRSRGLTAARVRKVSEISLKLNSPPVSGPSKQIIVNNENAPPAVAGGSKSHQQTSKTVWPPPPPASMLPRHPLASSSPADHLPARQGFGARSALTSGSSQNVSFQKCPFYSVPNLDINFQNGLTLKNWPFWRNRLDLNHYTKSIEWWSSL